MSQSLQTLLASLGRKKNGPKPGQTFLEQHHVPALNLCSRCQAPESRSSLKPKVLCNCPAIMHGLLLHRFAPHKKVAIAKRSHLKSFVVSLRAQKYLLLQPRCDNPASIPSLRCTGRFIIQATELSSIVTRGSCQHYIESLPGCRDTPPRGRNNHLRVCFAPNYSKAVYWLRL